MNPIPQTPIVHDCRILNQINELEFVANRARKTPSVRPLTRIDGRFAGYLRSQWRKLESAEWEFGFASTFEFRFFVPIAFVSFV